LSAIALAPLPDDTPDPVISRDPASGAVLMQTWPTNLEAQIAAARAAYAGWACQPLSTRVDAVRRLTGALRQRSQEFAETIARDTGRPMWDCFAEVEAALARVDGCVRAYADRCAHRRHESGANGAVAVRHKPMGVLAVITTFCQPMLTPLSHIAPAILAGNAVVFKPSSRALPTALLIEDCIKRAGLAANIVQIAVAQGEAAMDLAAHDGVDGVLFSGSTQVGQNLARRIAGRPGKLLSLDMGGNNAIVVWDTPQIEDAAMLVVQSAFTASGQRATCARRLIVREAMAEPLLGAVKRLADRIICGAPSDETTPFMGPLIDNRAADGLVQSFIWLMSRGGRPIKHMARLDPQRPFISPAIIDVTDMRERPDVELFGPLLQVIRVPDFDTAIAQANATRYGLVSALIGGTQEEYNRFWANVRTGLTHWNRATITELPGVPSGGVGLSGNFRPGGYYEADSCAYPVSSAEMDHPRAMIGTGFAPEI